METPYGTCSRHPSVRVRSENGLMTAPCGACEQEMAITDIMMEEWEHIDTHGSYSYPAGPHLYGTERIALDYKMEGRTGDVPF